MRPALLIIDMQKRWINKDKELYPSMNVAINNIQRIRDKFHSKDFPVIHIVMEHKKDSSTLAIDAKELWMIEGSKDAEIIDGLTPINNEPIIIKRRYSAFHRTNLLEILHKLEVNELIITGYQLAACINTTTVDAYQYDFRHYVISDASLEISEKAQTKYLDMYRNAKILKTTDELLNLMDDPSLGSLCQDCMKE